MPAKLKVAKVSELPVTGGKVVLVLGRAVALFRTEAGVRAVDDMCPHMGASLSEGHVCEDHVSCPWHGWEFSLEHGKARFSSMVSVRAYPVTVEGDDVFVDWPDA